MSANHGKILLATAKGLVVYEQKEGKWELKETFFLGQPVSMVYVDERHGIWWAALAHRHWGQKLHFSRDKGVTWDEVSAPKYPEGSMITEGKPATLKYIWSIAHGGEDQPERLFVGTDPGGLFISEDMGKSFELVQSLWDHPSRPDHWFGGGRDNAGIHSIVLDPRDSNHIYIGVSCAGVFESTDGGLSWQAINQGLRADYLPDPQGQYGHDPHAIRICRNQPDVIWQQNHCGIFRSVDAGQHWEEVSGTDGLAYYGFSLAIDHHNSDRAWVIPATSDQVRVAIDQSLCVCRTDDAGKSWRTIREGLPQGHSFDIVLRHSFARMGKTLVFGTNTGNLFISNDDGESWRPINNYLPTIFALCFAD